MRELQLVERAPHFSAPCQHAHPTVVKFVVVAKSLAFLQVGSRSLGKLFSGDNVRLIYNLVLQLPPFNVQPAFVGFFSQRRLLKNLVNLCPLRNLWLRRPWAFVRTFSY